jgi:CDP-paratose 2-epimerase
MCVFITGGAGFIGSNAAEFFLRKGHKVVIFDNFSRPGSSHNRVWLKRTANAGKLKIVKGDICDIAALLRAVPEETKLMLHLAGQVAVTTSVKDPRSDFEANALGTFNVLEAMRGRAPKSCLIYSSTNKVYGGLEKRRVVETATRYKFVDRPFGIDEDEPLDFHSPYGCSKGCGDQYVRDYARIYGLKTIVFRQSCIYGHRQFGVEDQGWIAHFCIAALKKKSIRIYGNGKQVRDVLWIDDLLRAYEMAFKHIAVTAGGVYNIGGGTKNSVSIWKEFHSDLEKLAERQVQVEFHPTRPGDQAIYISDGRKAGRDFGWKPETSFSKGLERLWKWLNENVSILDQISI